MISELSGLAFDSLQQAFRPCDLDVMFNQTPPDPINSQALYIAIDPAAGGPSSDYALVSIVRHKGLITVNFFHEIVYNILKESTISAAIHCSFLIHG